MNKEALLVFMQRILENGSNEKSILALQQLRAILQAQNTDPSLIALVNSTLLGIPEAKEAAKEPLLTEMSLRIALKRAEDRRRREEAAARQGRC